VIRHAEIPLRCRWRAIFPAALWLIVVCVWSPAIGQSVQPPAAGGAQQFAKFGEFKLQSGAVLHNFRLGYRTLGTLNADKSNAILWPSWLSGRSEDLLQFIGPQNVVDSTRYFVILVDAIGNGISTSPSNSMSQPVMKFPQFTIRDMVESEHRLVTEVLHVPHLRAVMGLSMGGMQTFEWAVAYPDFMDVTIPMAGSPQSTAYDKLLWTCEINAIELDPAWNNGNPTGPLTRGVALAEEIDSMNSTSPEYRETHTAARDFETFLAGAGKIAKTEPGVAADQIRQRQAIMTLDIPREFAAPLEQVAKRVHSRMLVVVSLQDHTVNPAPAEDFARAIGAPVVMLNSPCGHQGFSCISIGPIVAQFLADPSSVHSQTLNDPSTPRSR
jgi:homoserine O-acetyltransferase